MPNEQPKHLELLFKALKTIKPTSVEPERAFSAMGFFVTKIRNRMSDKTLDALITMKCCIRLQVTTLFNSNVVWHCLHLKASSLRA